MSIRVFDPTAEDAPAITPGVARLTSLAGRTIALLDNGKFRVRELLDHVEAILRTRFGVAQVLRFRKPDASRPAPSEMLADMQRCEAIIAAVGD
jgi:uncharacterized protein YbjT (DUF2867 family)